MIKQKLTSAKNFISDYRYELGFTAVGLAICAAAIADPEAFAEAATEAKQEVIETATKTIIIIEK